MKDWLTSYIPLFSPVATAILGAILAFYFTSRTKRDESMIRFKEEKYAKLLVKLQGFVGTTVSAQLKKEFFEEQYQSWLYASDEVVEAINDLILLIISNIGKTPDKELGDKAIGNVVLAMRKDLLKSTKLSPLSFKYINVIEDK